MSLLRYAQILIVFSRGEKEGGHRIDAGEVVGLEGGRSVLPAGARQMCGPRDVCRAERRIGRHCTLGSLPPSRLPLLLFGTPKRFCFLPDPFLPSLERLNDPPVRCPTVVSCFLQRRTLASVQKNREDKCDETHIRIATRDEKEDRILVWQVQIPDRTETRAIAAKPARVLFAIST